MDLEFSIEFPDAPLGGRELRALGGREAWDESSVDVLLPSSEVDGLIADAQVAGEIGDPPSRGKQIEDASAELGWIPTSSHGCLLWWTAA